MVYIESKLKTEKDKKDWKDYKRWKYRNENLDQIKLKDKNYYEKNKEDINSRRREKYKNDEKYREEYKTRSKEHHKKTYKKSTRKIMTPEGKKVAQRKAQDKYRALNRAKVNSARRVRYAKNPKPEIERSIKNRDQPRQNELRKKRYKEDEEYKKKQLDRAHKFYENNTEYFKEYQKVYRQTEKGKAIRAVLAHNRRALIKAAGSFKWQDWLVLKNTSPMCNMCGQFVGCELMTIDHKIPLSKEGPNTIDNIQPLCLSCNCRKNDFVREEVMKDLLMMTVKN